MRQYTRNNIRNNIRQQIIKEGQDPDKILDLGVCHKCGDKILVKYIDVRYEHIKLIDKFNNIESHLYDKLPVGPYLILPGMFYPCGHQYEFKFQIYKSLDGKRYKYSLIPS